MASVSKSNLIRLIPALGLIATLAACGSTTISEELDAVTPTGSPFSQAQFKDYSFLARSFGDAAENSTSSAFDSDSSMSLTGTSSDVSDLAGVYAAKALAAAKGDEVLPETPPDADADADAARLRLLRGLEEGRAKAPVDAARAQADFDCWILNGHVDSQHAAAEACHRSFGASMARLESDLNPAPAPAPTPAPVASAPMAPAANYTVYFDWDSWTLTAEDLTTITEAINAARAGQQSHIIVVGHTDTSGSAGFNQGLSVRRAEVVKEVLVQMGARPEAIQTSGVGEGDLAVQTGDGVKEAKNRRTVITLQP
ncbi:MAG TPA: OmpA family protein [Rhizomicrobium sp.]|jgi:outer membrane protein OmpA-like peptidoglycan-associated protein